MQIPGPRTIVSFALLVAVALVSSYMLSSVQQDEKKPRKPRLSLAYYLDRATLTGTDADGAVVFRVRTRRAAQSPDDKGIEMEKVKLVYGPPTALPWEVRADTGRIPEDASVIKLSGNVIAISEAEGAAATIIRTDRLDVDPETRNATTDADVQIEFGGRSIAATGMKANFETNDLQLLSNVYGRFLP